MCLFENEKFRKEVEEDCKIKKENIDIDLIVHSEAIQKYITLLAQRSKSFADKQREHDSIYKDKYDYYKYQYTKHLENKSEIDVYIKGDTEYSLVKKELDDLSADVNFLNQVINNLNQKSWNMKNIIEWEKYMKGMR